MTGCLFGTNITKNYFILFVCISPIYVISASPEEVVQSALEGIVPPENIDGTRLRYNSDNEEIQSIERVSAGYGKAVVLNRLQASLGISSDRVVYVGDGSSDVHVMLHANRRDGFTISISESKFVNQVAKRTVMSDNSFSVVVPILEDVIG